MYVGDNENIEASKSNISEAKNTVNDYMDEVKGDLKDSATKTLYEKVKTNIDDYFSDVDKCLEYFDAGKIQDARNYLKDNGVKSADKAEENIKKLINEIDKYAQKKQDYVIAQNKKGDYFVAFIMIIALANAFVAFWFIMTTIRNPLVELAGVAKKVSAGEVDVDITPSKIDNEVGALVDGFQAMVDNLKNQADTLKLISDGDMTVSYQPKSDSRKCDSKTYCRQQYGIFKDKKCGKSDNDRFRTDSCGESDACTRLIRTGKCHTGNFCLYNRYCK
jgi:methyl-accepting chemotaxis protein